MGRGVSLAGSRKAMLKAAVSTYQALVADCPDVPEYRHSLGRTYRALGGQYFNSMRQGEKAEAAHQRARANL